jgi:hypothetical protein
MSDSGRLHRNDPVRPGPIRNFSNLYKQTATAQSPAHCEGAPGTTSSNGRSSEGVATAYSVLEKHINEGRDTARQYSRAGYETRIAVDGIQRLIEESLRYQLEMLPLLLETFTSLLPPESARAFSGGLDGWPQHRGNGASATGNGNSAAMAIEVASRQPAEVALSLGNYANLAELVTPGLHSIEPGQPSITDITFREAPAGGRAKLRVVVPDNQAPGIYSGAIVNRRTGEPLGTLTVRIAE